MFFDNRWDEADWRNESAAAERDENAREARDLADWHAGDSPAITAFLDATTADAPAGRYVMEGESEIEQALRQIGDLREAPEPINFGVELSTASMLRARFGKRVA